MKKKTVYVCSLCGAAHPKWQGQCRECGAWNSLVEETEVVRRGVKKSSSSTDKPEPQKISEIDSAGEFRLVSNIKEFDRTLGGGVVPGSVILLVGEPGIGKSTLALQICAALSEYSPLYVSGEESAKQIKYRSERLRGDFSNVYALAETNLEKIEKAIVSSDSKLVVVDSIQSVWTETIDSAPGSVSQARESAAILTRIAKSADKAVIVVGHVTKDGLIAGPKLLEHIVDVSLYFEGDRTYSLRLLRSLKNRFGSTNELGIFEMTDKGLIEAPSPSEILLSDRDGSESGVAVVASMEGSRPLLIETQALAAPSRYAAPQRISNGFDIKRLNMILAVLEKRLGEKFGFQDVFVNAAGGVKLADPAADAAIAAALLSSLKNLAIDPDTVIVGEVGLTGEVRAVSSIDKRIKESEKLGFKRIIIPKSSFKKAPKNVDIEITPIDRISSILAILFR